ncbi:MAG: baseplate J/gp47 family protein [Alphaproteobacteria bacterium]|nr:baseplate J/gp47 family protein [Alphaproteobacteria bacterium]
MYENITYEDILQRMLDRISASYDRREASLIWDALAPAAVELKQMYMELDVILAETFADTASRENLIRRAAERGISPFEATKAVVVGDFTPTTLEIPIGSRFSCEDVNYVVTEKVANGRYYLESEMAGDIGNIRDGTLIMIDNINGLASAKITSVSIYGEDEESTETFRNRYFASLQSEAFGGNKTDYKTKTKSQGGVGGVKVYGAQEWNGGGTVKLVVQSSEWGVPSTNLIETLQETIDPVENSGLGNGIAPIGHHVAVVPVTGKTINLALNLTYEDNYNWSLVQSDVLAEIDNYFKELNQSWDSLDNIIVRISQIESRLLSVKGVLDIGGTTINERAENLQLDKDSIAIRGTVNG